MLLFFQNGGGTCYVVSVGDYNEDIDKDKLIGGVTALLTQQEPTIVVIPDAMRLAKDLCCAVQQQALRHCGTDMKNRIALFDIVDAGADPAADPDPSVQDFRNAIGAGDSDTLSYAAAYYPWLNTTIVDSSGLDYRNIASGLKDLLTAEGTVVAGPRFNDVLAAIDNAADLSKTNFTPVSLHNALSAASRTYILALGEIQRQLNVLPPSPTIAGVYTMVDAASGVWTAPANVTLSAVASPAVTISDQTQQNLNVDLQGKSINVVRSFAGKGVLVWGARTLDGNSLDWRYISVRRTTIFLEESIRLAMKAYVFADNVSSTWVAVKSMIGTS